MLDVTVSINANDFDVSPQTSVSRRRRFVSSTRGIAAPENLPTEEQRRSSRASLNISDGDLLIVAGRLSREKGVHVLIRSLARLPKMLQLAIVGDGPQRSELEALTRELGLADRVRFLGFLRKPPAMSSVARTLRLFHPLVQAFGRVVVEAMSLGAPVVASRDGMAGLSRMAFTGGTWRPIMWKILPMQ
ncbi:MAG: glycosyltransferase [Burkholderiales bacterium]